MSADLPYRAVAMDKLIVANRREKLVLVHRLAPVEGEELGHDWRVLEQLFILCEEAAVLAVCMALEEVVHFERGAM